MVGIGPIRKMSAIAAFWLLHNDAVPALRALANSQANGAKEPVPSFTSQPPERHDAFYELMRLQGKELERYPWSGYVFAAETRLFLEERRLALDEFVDDDLTTYLRRVLEIWIYAFRLAGSERLVEALDQLKTTDAEVHQFLEANATYSAETEHIQAVRDGLKYLMKWLSQVDAEHVGLLTIR